MKESTDEKLERAMLELMKIHAQVSHVDFERNRKKHDPEMSSAISFLAQGIGSLQKYMRSRTEKGIYGKEEN